MEILATYFHHAVRDASGPGDLSMGGHPTLCNAPPQWLRMRHQSHQSMQEPGQEDGSQKLKRSRGGCATVE